MSTCRSTSVASIACAHIHVRTVIMYTEKLNNFSVATKFGALDIYMIHLSGGSFKIHKYISQPYIYTSHT
jgi:hypothetical protein